MLCFGIIGALAWYLVPRVRESESLLRLMLVGLLGGVSSLLFVQGWKQVFLSEGVVDVMSFNPWTSGIFSFIAGLAAFRTNLLTALVDEIVDFWKRVR
jgi:hypothetical protein